MKKTLFLLLLFCALRGHGQENSTDKSVMLLTTFTIPDRSVLDTLGKKMDIDTLMNIYRRAVELNPMIKSFRVLIHYYGPDSHKVLFITEIDAMRNIDLADEKTNELVNASFTSEIKRKEFWRVWNRLFDRHEDALMQDFVKPK